MSELRTAREAAGLSTVEASKLLGIGRATLYRYETGVTAKLDHALVERMKTLYRSRTRRTRKGEPRHAG